MKREQDPTSRAVEAPDGRPLQPHPAQVGSARAGWSAPRRCTTTTSSKRVCGTRSRACHPPIEGRGGRRRSSRAGRSAGRAQRGGRRRRRPARRSTSRPRAARWSRAAGLTEAGHAPTRAAVSRSRAVARARRGSGPATAGSAAPPRPRPAVRGVTTSPGRAAAGRRPCRGSPRSPGCRPARSSSGSSGRHADHVAGVVAEDRHAVPVREVRRDHDGGQRARLGRLAGRPGRAARPGRC